MNNILTKHRECKQCPPHFIRVKTSKPVQQGTFAALLDDGNTVQRIRNWCYENIEHRFFVGSYTDLNPAYHVVIDYEVAAFEDSADATYFSLMLPTIIK